MQDDIILELQDIKKVFPGVVALDKAHLRVYRNEVMGLVGENGAGKSTICKIITGVYNKTSGKIFYNGEEVHFKNIKESKKAGIAIMHQELQMCKDITVVENLFLGSEIKTKLGLYDWTAMRRLARGVLESLNVTFDVNTIVRTLSVGQQQMIEIARAVLQDAQLIILDEPTAALTDREVASLFKIVLKLKDAGKSFIYISHRLPELPKICDRLTVFRDGQFIMEDLITNFDEDRIVEAIAGRPITDQYPYEQPRKEGPEILRIENFQNKFLKDVSLNLRSGTCTGLFGLMGAGRTELAKTLIGEYGREKGKVILDGKKINLSSPAKAKSHGIFYCSEDRKSEALILNYSIQYNVTMSSPEKLVYHKWLPIVKLSNEGKLAKEYIEKMQIKTPSARQKVYNLSGGNQQKVVLAKAMLVHPDILILDEPTRGIDVGAKYNIYKLINEFKQQGLAVLMISSDLPEVIGISDYIYVMADGKMKALVDNREPKVTQETVMKLTIA